MNPALIILVILGLVILWCLLSFVFFPLGKIISHIGKDAVHEMNRDENEEIKEKTNEDR